MIKLVRVDHRLLHGQVAMAWTQSLDVDCMLIANDAIMKDEIRNHPEAGQAQRGKAGDEEHRGLHHGPEQRGYGQI